MTTVARVPAALVEIPQPVEETQVLVTPSETGRAVLDIACLASVNSNSARESGGSENQHKDVAPIEIPTPVEEAVSTVISS